MPVCHENGNLQWVSLLVADLLEVVEDGGRTRSSENKCSKTVVCKFSSTLDSWAVHRTHFNFGIVLFFFLFLLLLLCWTWLYYNKGYFNGMSTCMPMASLLNQAVEKKRYLYHPWKTFPTFGLNFFLSFLNITSEANTRLGPGCLRSLLGFTMLLSLSCQQHVCWTNIWKMCFLPNFTVFHHARIYCTERCLLKMVLGCFWNFLRTNENNTENQTCYIMNATLTTWTSLKNVAHGEIQWHCHNVNRVTMASTPKPRSCISALTTSLSWRFFETYGNIHFVISCTCMICMRVYDLYWRIQNSNRRNMCEYMQYMCEFENRIKNNTNTPHHYWDDSSHLSCLPLQVHTSCPPFLAVRRNLSKGGKLA